MNVASPGHELNPGHLVYQKDVSNPPSKSRLEGDEAKDGGGLWSIRGSTSASLSAGNQTTISDGVSLREVMSQYCQAGINTEWTDVLLIISGFVSGLVDGLSFNSWGSFSSMQTGNTVFIALGVSGQPTNPPYLWAKSLISLVVFLTSNLFFIYASRALHPLRRSTLVLSFGIQTAAILAAALLVQLGAVDSKPEDPRAPIQWMQCLPIALLAFQAAGQIVASRVLAYDEIPTVVLTALFCDLLVDPKLFDRPWKANPKRNRRIAAFLALFLGAMTAGGLSKETTMTASLWLAMGLKLVITLSFFLWKDDRSVTPKRRDEESG